MSNAVTRTFRAARDDNISGEAAKVAFYLFLSLFPAILAMFALAGLFGGEPVFRWVMERIETSVPGETAALLERFVRQVTMQQRPGVLSVGLLLTLWAASGGVAALADGLNAMFDVSETRSWWKKRAIALGLLIAGTVLVLGGAVAILAGPALVRAAGLGPIWDLLRWPLAFVLLWVLLTLTYIVLPDRDQSKAKGAIVTGGLVGAVLWLVATGGFRLYVANFGRYGETYGFVGAIIVLMLWLYLTAMVILFGGEVAAVLARPERTRERTRFRRAA